ELSVANHIIGIIERNPECEINFRIVSDSSTAYTPMEIALSLTPSKERSKLLVCLILAGAELSDNATEEWELEFDKIVFRLKEAFRQGRLNQTSLKPQFDLDIINIYLPELQDFPPEKLGHGLKVFDLQDQRFIRYFRCFERSYRNVQEDVR